MSVIKYTLLFFVIAFSVQAVDLTDGLEIPLIDEQGRETSIAGYDGQYRLVFFGYTFCPDICPLTLLQVGRALKSIDDIENKLIPLFISIDPIRDNPDKLRQYTDAFHPDLVGLSGEYDDLVELNRQFRTTFGFTAEVDGQEQSLDKEQYLSMSADSHYVPYHSSQIYLLDRNGELLDIIGYGSQANQIADKINSFLR